MSYPAQTRGPLRADRTPRVPAVRRTVSCQGVADLGVCRHQYALCEAAWRRRPGHRWRNTASHTPVLRDSMPQIAQIDVRNASKVLHITRKDPIRRRTPSRDDRIRRAAPRPYDNARTRRHAGFRSGSRRCRGCGPKPVVTRNFRHAPERRGIVDATSPLPRGTSATPRRTGRPYRPESVATRGFRHGNGLGGRHQRRP